MSTTKSSPEELSKPCNHCTLMMLYICTMFHKISKRVFELCSGHEIKMDEQMDRQPDKIITIGPPPTSSGSPKKKKTSFSFDS